MAEYALSAAAVAGDSPGPAGQAAIRVAGRSRTTGTKSVAASGARKAGRWPGAAPRHRILRRSLEPHDQPCRAVGALFAAGLAHAPAGKGSPYHHRLVHQ